MELKDQVTSPILSKQLSDLGIKGNSLYYWVWNDFNRLVLQTSPMIITGSAPDFEQHEAKEYYSAYTVAELGEMLPEKVCWSGYVNYEGKWSMRFADFKAEAITEADMKAKMLIYLKENNLI